MKIRKTFSLLLGLLLLLPLPMSAPSALAAEGDSGMVLSKTAVANGDGSYTITLEAYATGSKVISEVKKDIPTDIVLVLDQSGSMAEPIGSVSFELYKDETGLWDTTYHTRNKDYYEQRHNGGNANLWHKLDNGSYVSVSVTKTMKFTELSGYMTNYDYYYYQNNLFEKVGDEYKKVTVEQSNNWRTYTYTFADGTKITSNGSNRVPDFGSHAPLYTPASDDNTTVYTYTYTDADGNIQLIGTSTGANTVFSPTLYQRVVDANSGAVRLDALKTAVTTFANSVAEKAKGEDGTSGTKDDINHRIAVVGFSSDGYHNTELLTGVNITTGDQYYGTEPVTGGSYYYFPTGHEKNGVQYGSITDEQYGNALQSMDNATGKANVAAAFDALTAYGGTYTDDGMAMANKIFEKNPIETGKKRNRVVIVFTDGVPGLTGYQSSVANDAIAQGTTAKSTYGATVYTVGVFSGADATSAGSANGTETQKANWFMQNLSSNNGTPQTPSYYLSAADAGTLSSIFKQISDQIESGGSTTTLSSETVIKDIIAPSFALPEDATASDITLKTYACTGKNGDKYTWNQNVDAMGATATINGDQVSVSGFDFAANYVGPVTNNGNVTYRGNKLVISFKVQPKAGFLGGNDVFTNTSAGVYENSSATDPVLTFDRPKVDVAIERPTIMAPGANVYLGAYYSATVDAEELKEGMSVSFGDGVKLDLTKPNENWGLENWQTEYVDIEVKVTDKDGNPVTELARLTEDTEYKVSVSITPKTFREGNSGYNEAEAGTIHVFKPVLTFEDSTVNYLSTYSDYLDSTSNTPFDSWDAYYAANNYQSLVWKHGDIIADGVTMLGTEPALTLTYETANDDIDATNKVVSTTDVPVKVQVAVGEGNDMIDATGHTTFVHTPCNPACGWNETVLDGDPAFLLHVVNVTGELTITKSGLLYTSDEDCESALFTVTGGGKTFTVAINGNDSVTISNLPAGEYTVTEQNNWTWRYASSSTGLTDGKVTVPGGGKANVTFTNTQDNTKWLGGDNYKKNEFSSN